MCLYHAIPFSTTLPIVGLKKYSYFGKHNAVSRHNDVIVSFNKGLISEPALLLSNNPKDFGYHIRINFSAVTSKFLDSDGITKVVLVRPTWILNTDGEDVTAIRYQVVDEDLLQTAGDMRVLVQNPKYKGSYALAYSDCTKAVLQKKKGTKHTYNLLSIDCTGETVGRLSGLLIETTLSKAYKIAHELF